MPWCPRCKNEYKEGITVCADCGCELVDSLEEQDVPIYFGPEEEIDEMITFFKANNMEGAYKLFDDKEQTFELIVKKRQLDEAKNAIRVYLKEFATTEEEETQKERTVNLYEDSNKRAEEYQSGAYTLLLVGIVGLILLVLLNLNVLPINLPQFTKILITCVMGIMFVLFVFLGVTSLNTYKKLKMNAEDENQQQDDIKNWFLSNITKEMIYKPNNIDKETEEELFFKRTDKMKSLIKEKYPSVNEEFVDYIVEQLYTDIYEQS